MKKTKEKFSNKAYRLLGEAAPLCYMLASRHTRRSPLLHFDEDQGINRPSRYARNQKSPFEDEQDGNAVLEPIVFEDGMLQVQKSNQTLQQFLHFHPSNGKVFEEINHERDAAMELQYVEMGLEAQIIAKELKGDKLLTVCRVLMGGYADNLTTAELRRDVLIYAKNNADDFLDTVQDPMLELYGDVVTYFNNTWLVLKNNGKDVYFNLPKNKSKLLSVPFGEDHYHIVASYFQVDDGVETYKLLKKKAETK